MGAPNLSCPEAERSVLAAVLMEPHRLPDVRELLRVEDFEDPRHAATLRAICQLEDSSAPISELGADAILKADKRVSPPESGWLHYLAEILLAVTSAARLTYHCTIVAESARLRRLVTACRAAAEQAATIRPGQGEADEFIDAIEARIFEIGQRGFGACKGLDMSEVVPGVVAEITSGRQELGWATGLDDVDHLLSGLRQGELLIVAARPSLGKTAFATQVALNCAKDGASVLFLSLEMSTSSLAQRMIANLGSIPFNAIRSGRLLPEELGRFHEAAQELSALKIRLIEDNGTTVSRLRGMARRHAANVGLDLIVVDYLQLMSHSGAKDRLQEVSAISRSLKSLARELRVPVLAVSQLSRAGSEGRPKLHHLRETGSLEQDADVVIMLWDDGNGGPLRCAVEKNRHGSTGDMNLFFNKPSLKIAGLALDRGVPLT